MKRTLFVSLLLFIMATAFTDSARTITGMITDDAGKPVIAYIQVKNSQKGTVCAADGSFKLEIADDKTVLVVSALGFETKEVAVKKEQVLTIRLKPSTQALQEVVVTRYGGSMKKEMTPPSTLTDMRQYDKSLRQQLQGKVAGVNIRMRGMASAQLTKSQIMYERQPRYYDTQVLPDREGYDHIIENPFLTVTDNPLSTFSIDVDAASYSNVRRILKSGQMPQAGAVRIEEMINYFSYRYTQPTGNDPFAVHTELAVCPWNTSHQLVLIGMQGKKIETQKLPPGNFTFLIDVSGSMSSHDKLPLVQSSMKLLVDQLREEDKVAIVVYAGTAGLVLPPTSGYRKADIKEAIDRLQAGGSTAGGEGIQLAYKIARQNFNKEGNNRVILCTDGDFNMGQSSDDELERMIENERKSGVYLTVLGFGTGNYQDAKMQKLADKGNGNHAYIDGISEAKKVLINEFGGTMFTIAKDVKLQVEFNPAKIKGYRLIGYENRVMAKEDFNNDKKDAGELGSGHTVTALYELIPQGVAVQGETTVDPLRYQTPLKAISTSQAKYADEVMTIKLRYKHPDSDQSTLLSYPFKGLPVAIEQASNNFRFAAAVASFGMVLRNSSHRGDAGYPFIHSLAKSGMDEDVEGYRKEFLQLVDMASRISRRKEMAGRNEEK